MQIEHEAKALEIDPDQIAERIRELGGQDLGEVLQRRYVYDVIPPDPNKWIRLRDQGDRVTLTVKEIKHDGIDGTSEVEETVESFDGTAAVLEAIGLHPRGYQENRRHSFKIGEVELEIDTWPRIPAYLEIEAATSEEVLATARKLGLDTETLTSENTTKVYARYGIDIKSIEELRFPDEAEVGQVS